MTVRASEDTRSRAVAALQRGYATGALHTGTFAHRVDRALTARTHNELRGLTADLEAAPAVVAGGCARGASPPAGQRPRSPCPTPPGSRAPPSSSAAAPAASSSSPTTPSPATTPILHVRDGAWFVRDQGSLNGTWVNGRRVVEAELRPGDELRLGELAMRL